MLFYSNIKLEINNFNNMKKENKILIYRLLFISIFVIIMTLSLNANNYIVPIIAFLILIIISAIFNNKFIKSKDIIIDERDYKISGKASFWAIRIYALPTALLGFIFTICKNVPFIKENNLDLIGQILSLSVCVLLITYSIVFRVLRNKGE